MDKYEVIGYSVAGACLVATLAVFFLWIMPANAAIATDLGRIKTQGDKLKAMVGDNDTAVEKDPADIKNINSILELSKHFLVTPVVESAAKKARATLSARTAGLIQNVVKAHEVTKPEMPVDKLRKAQEIRKELQKLFDDAKVPFAGAANYNLSPDSALSVDEKTFRTFQLFQQVSAALLNASTNVTWNKPTVDPGSHSLNSLQQPTTEKVSAILYFAYFEPAQWANLLKKYQDETTRAARQENTSGLVPNSANPLGYETFGCRVVFRTNPVNVNAALASLEKLEGRLVTVTRLEVIRAGSPLYNASEAVGRENLPIPLPFRDGDVQVMAEFEVLGFPPKTAEGLTEKMYKPE